MKLAGLHLEAVLFDLDGTLVDSAADIAAAVDGLLAEDGLAPLGIDTVAGMIGHGVAKLLERAYAARGLALDAAEFSVRLDAMMQRHYGAHLTGLTTARAGAVDFVMACKTSGLRTAVVTNKPEPFVQTILDHYGFAASIDLVLGGRAGRRGKPAPDMLVEALDALGARPDGTLMVGDSAADAEAARAAGARCALLRGGYSTTAVEDLGADIVVDGFAALMPLLGRRAS